MPRRSSATLLSPPIIIILLPTFIILFLIYTLPPILSFITSHILQPTISVKKSWDSLNVFLVVFAILCGVFACKQHDEDAATQASLPHHDINANSISSNASPLTSSRSVLHVPAQQEWFGYETTNEAPVIKTPEINVVDGGGGRLRRRSSYPDMRQVESLWETLDDVSNKSSQFRFFDDFEISNDKTHHHRHNNFGDDVIVRETKPEDDVIIKEIKVDTFVPKPSPSPPPPARRTFETVAKRKKERVEEVKSPEEVTPEKSPAPVPAMRVRSDGSRLERRKSNVKREIAMVWNSVLSNQRKRKRKQKAMRNIENGSPATPAPPTPPPPSSVFQNLFKKGSKPKKTHSLVPTPPPEKVIPPSLHEKVIPTAPSTPPPRPPPAAISRRRPPLPKKPINKYYDDNVMIINSGSQNPLIPIPPTPPPFKIPAMRFLVKGDYVKIRSRSASPELDDDHQDHAGNEKSTLPVNEMNGGDVTGKVSTSVFCPSPDVNTKADNFIARLRDEWRLEKINSLRSTS